MRSNYFRLVVTLAVNGLAMSRAFAAPFCVQTEALPPQCLYFDAASCATNARQMHGSCGVNTAELHIAPGLGHYCLVTSGLVSSCVYLDGSSCDVEAKRQHGVCVTEPARAESPPPDPYRMIRPLTAGGGARD